MTGWLLDVNVLLGCGWKSHANHSGLLNWLVQIDDSGLGYLRYHRNRFRSDQYDNSLSGGS